jgi:hypothetical protein
MSWGLESDVSQLTKQDTTPARNAGTQVEDAGVMRIHPVGVA